MTSMQPGFKQNLINVISGQTATVRDVNIRLSAQDIVEVQAELLGRQRFQEAVAALAQKLVRVLKCDRVTIGGWQEGAITVIAASDNLDFQSHQTTTRLVIDAMEEAVEQQATLIYPEPEKAELHILMAQEALSRHRGADVCTVPLFDHEERVGALMLERRQSHFTVEDIGELERLAALLAPIVVLKHDNQLSLWRHAKRDIWRWIEHWQDLPAASRKTLFSAGVAALLLIAIVLLWPMTYYVHAPARLEGVIQRIMASPADGFLHKVNVRPGDHVKANQILVELADQDMLVEQRGLQAELAQQENAVLAAQARNDQAEYVAHAGQVDAIQAKLDLLAQQLERSQVRAPFDGIVIEGDLTQSIGAPVQLGQQLLTLAPESGHRLLIEAEEGEVADVEPGQRGHLVLAALPSKTFGFRIERITPLASSSEGRHYFPVYGLLDSESDALKPGMRGYVKIEAGKRSMLLNALSATWNALRLHSWAWGL